MDKQKKLIAALVKEIAAARNLIAETEKALAESETALIEKVAEITAQGTSMVELARVFPGYAECNLDWNMVALARTAFLQRAAAAERAAAGDHVVLVDLNTQGANHE